MRGCLKERWADFYFCKWPDEIQSVSEYFLKINEPNISAYNGIVITLSHFLPHCKLLPAVSKLDFKGLPLVTGSLALDSQIRALNLGVESKSPNLSQNARAFREEGT